MPIKAARQEVRGRYIITVIFIYGIFLKVNEMLWFTLSTDHYVSA